MRRGIVLHPAFERAKEGLLRAMNTDVPGQLIFVIGMSGAGKSEIRYATMRTFAKDPSTWGAGKIPVIAVRATPSDRSYFNSKEFVSRLNLEVLEPDLGWLAQRVAIDDVDQGHLRAEARLTDPFWRNMRSQRTEHQLRTVSKKKMIGFRSSVWWSVWLATTASPNLTCCGETWTSPTLLQQVCLASLCARQSAEGSER